MRLRHIFVLKPEGGKHRPITLDTRKLSIYPPIRRHHPHKLLPALNTKHNNNRQLLELGLKRIIKGFQVSNVAFQKMRHFGVDSLIFYTPLISVGTSKIGRTDVKSAVQRPV